MRKIARGVARLYVIRYSIYKMAMACYSTFHTEAGREDSMNVRHRGRVRLCALCYAFCVRVFSVRVFGIRVS